MATEPETKKAPTKGDSDHVWIGLFDGLVGLFTGAFSTRIGFSLFLFFGGLLLILAPVQGDLVGAKIMLRTLGIGALIGAAFLFRSGIREKRREQNESTEGSKPPVRRVTTRRRR